MSEIVPQITAFLEEIGINVVERELTEDTFLPGLTIANGCLYVDYSLLKYPGDLLHEAGHLAVTTSESRKLAGTPQAEGQWPTDGEEIAAVLWSFAALKRLNLPAETVFHENGYKGQSEWLIEQFENGEYIGLPFLEWAGLAYGPKTAAEKNAAPFPEMISWMRKS